jgi:GH15 family glucan-1,4-alpha-glucosidase
MIKENKGSGQQISDYALTGNCRTAALVSNTGSIDWCCLPEFHSAAIFARILDHDNGGYFSIRPVAPFQSAQRYIPDTNVVETTFSTENGTVRLTDAFTATTEERKREALFPDHEILRVIESISGSVRVRVEYAPKLFYGKVWCELKDHKAQGIQFTWKEGIYILRSTLGVELSCSGSQKNVAESEFIMQPGDKFIFSLSYSSQCPAIIPELTLTGLKRMEETIHFWKAWISRCKYDGVYQAQLRRSALALKLLTHAPSGAIIAAPTTSLPEEIGGNRNWDYRYCWLRDAAFTTKALVELGFEEEASAYLNWIRHATQLTHPKLQVVYSVYGHSRLVERLIEWLPGYKKSKPVRIGNGADGQFQLDVYGEVIDAFYMYASVAGKPDRSTRRFIIGLGEMICKLWQQPDNGIWEIRSSPEHHTHSKVMAWVGLDRLIRLSSAYKWRESKIEKYKSVASAIRRQIETHGYNEALQTYTRTFDGTTADASLLVLPLAGYCRADDPRMLSTTRYIRTQLSENKLLYRYLEEDGLPGREGSFAICNFWLSENLARCGNFNEAIEVFQMMSAVSSATGLLSEQVHPRSKELLGNYPQGFSHIGLINAALALESSEV